MVICIFPETAFAFFIERVIALPASNHPERSPMHPNSHAGLLKPVDCPALITLVDVIETKTFACAQCLLLEGF